MAPEAVLKEQALQGDTLGTKFDPVKLPDYSLVKDHKLGKKYLKTAQTLPIYETAGRYNGFVCIIQGESDKIEPPLYTEKYCKVYKHCEYHLLKNEDHTFSINQNKAVDIVVEFLIKNLKPAHK